MTPSDYTYFDYYQGDPRREPLSIGGFIPLEKAYAYEPVPKQIAKDRRKIHTRRTSQLWTEYVATPEHAEYMMFPRLLAFAEAVWSPPAVRSYDDFRRRLPYQLGRLDKQDVRYRIPEPEGLKDFYTTSQDHAVVALSPYLPGAQMFYTLDGSEPSDDSTLYQAPLQIALRPEQPQLLKLVVVTPQGRRSVVYGATFLRRAYLEPIRAEAQPKLAFVLYDGKFASVRDIERGAKVARGTTESFDLQQFGRALNYAVQFEGFLKIDSDDFYQFVVDSDDGAVLEIDDEVVVDNDGNHAPRTIAGHVPSAAGLAQVSPALLPGGGWIVARRQLGKIKWTAAAARGLRPLPLSPRIENRVRASTGPSDRRMRTHHEMLDLAFELQQIFGILRIIFRDQQLVSREIHGSPAPTPTVSP